MVESFVFDRSLKRVFQCVEDRRVQAEQTQWAAAAEDDDDWENDDGVKLDEGSGV